MAEIKVEKKNKAPVWPWIIGILVLLGLIWFLIEAFEEDEMEYEEVETEEIGAILPSGSAEGLETVILPEFYQI